MIIKGIERNFELNVGSYEKLCEICEDQRIENLDKLLSNSNQAEQSKSLRKVAVILNEGYENHKNYDDPNYEPQFLTERDLLFLSVPEIIEMTTELQRAITSGMRMTVESEEIKPTSKQQKN